jgi:hypothetical protein
MTGPAWLRQARRRLRPRRDCWRYHRVDWHAVSGAAIRIALQAQASGTPPEDAAGAITPASCGLDGEDIEALGDLLTPENGSRSTMTTRTTSMSMRAATVSPPCATPGSAERSSSAQS